MMNTLRQMLQRDTSGSLYNSIPGELTLLYDFLVTMSQAVKER